MSVAATVARVGELAGLLTFAPPRAAALPPAALGPTSVGAASSSVGAASATPSPVGAMSSPLGASSATPFAAQLAASMAAPSSLVGAPSAMLGSSSAAPATPYAAEISAAAARNGIDPNLLSGLIRAESNFDPSATSPAGAQGLTQLMPATAAGLGVSNPLDPAQSIEGGARYLREQLDRFGGDPVKALAAYNAGPGAVERFGGVPPYAETQGYVRRVLSYAQGTLA